MMVGMSTIEKARALIEKNRYSMHSDVPVWTTEVSAEITLASQMSVVAQLRVELARSEVARYGAEYNLAQLQLDQAQKSLRRAEAESRGEA